MGRPIATSRTVRGPAVDGLMPPYRTAWASRGTAAAPRSRWAPLGIDHDTHPEKGDPMSRTVVLEGDVPSAPCIVDPAPLSHLAPGEAFAMEIGRASCRERVSFCV